MTEYGLKKQSQLLEGKINVTLFRKKDYERSSVFQTARKQTQTKPISKSGKAVKATARRKCVWGGLLGRSGLFSYDLADIHGRITNIFLFSCRK
ncbi:MAG: hypothetical protein PVJ86_06265 [Phycisphaerales bacterium]|jgi:hypothetical protein